MKVRLGNILVIVFFLLLVAGTLFFVKPAYDRLITEIDDSLQKLNSLVEEKTSLRVSYRSLSPSILSSFSVRNISLINEEDEDVINIQKIRINYSLYRILTKGVTEGLKTVVVDGVTVNGEWLASILNTDSGMEKESDVQKNSNGLDFFTDILSQKFPFEIILKNISFFYVVNQIRYELAVKKVSAIYLEQSKRIDLNLKSVVRLISSKMRFSCSIDADGSIFNGLDKSFLKLRISDLTDGNIHVNTLSVLGEYRDKILTARTIQSTVPFELDCFLNIENLDGGINIQCDKLNPVSLVSMKRRSKTYEKLRGIYLTESFSATGNILSKTAVYSNKTNLILPPSVLPEGAVFRAVFSGNEETVEINELSLAGNMYDISSGLSVDLKNIGVSGNISVSQVVLPNGTVMSTDFYFDPLNRGFMAFAPQVFINEKSLTAFQLMIQPDEDSVDFSVEISDYSHAEMAEPGVIAASGSYIISSKYLQSSLDVTSWSIESAMDIASDFMIEKNSKILSGSKTNFRDFVFASDAYVSTDMKSLSYNIPYILVANTKKTDQALMLALDGNDQSLSVSQMSLVLGRNAVFGTASCTLMDDNKGAFFGADFSVDQIPYHFSGALTNKTIHVTGDYNTEIEVNLETKISGTAGFEGLPVPLLGTSFVSSLESDFSWDEEKGPEVNISLFSMEEAGTKIGSAPKLSLSGNITGYGAQFGSIMFSDLYSSLDGNADIVWNYSEGIFSSAGMNLSLKNPLSPEKLGFYLHVTNPEGLALSFPALKESFYIDSIIDIKNYNLNRHTRINSDTNNMSASLSVTGTIEHPYIGLIIENIDMAVGGNTFSVKGNAFLEERNVTVTDMSASFGPIFFNNIRTDFSLDTFEGSLFTNLDVQFLDRVLHLPLKVKLSDCVKEKGKLVPHMFNASISSDGAEGNLIRKKTPFSIGAIYSETALTVVSSDNIGLWGTMSDDGHVIASVKNGNVLNARLAGDVLFKTGSLDLNIDDVFCDLGKLFEIINIDTNVKINRGVVRGAVKLTGSIDNPDMFGQLDVTNPDFQIPVIVQQHVTAPSFTVLMHNNEIELPETKFFVKKTNEVYISAGIFLNKWFLDHIECRIKNHGKNTFPVRLITPFVEIGGKANMDLLLVFEPGFLDVTGRINAEDAEIFSDLTKVGQRDIRQNNIIQQCNIDVLMGNHVRVNVEPVLRGLFVPNTHINVKFDSSTNDFAIDGVLNLKSGDIAYLNRNFYIKEGKIDFSNTSEGINPLITVRAETRERDDDGESVRIILSAEKQYLLDLNPRFSAIPAKSEAEIQRLLGQIVLADSDNVSQFIFAAGDYALAQTFGRRIENSLREFLNFDIFSVRTNILQNTMNIGLSNNRGGNEKITAGNFLDNSTVYIGKYLGSALYVDAMMHIEYDKDREQMGGIVFQPEIGMEFDSPFGNIRWSMAPDINAMLEQRYVPASTLSLSWKFSF